VRTALGSGRSAPAPIIVFGLGSFIPLVQLATPGILVRDTRDAHLLKALAHCGAVDRALHCTHASRPWLAAVLYGLTTAGPACLLAASYA
jgi:hypothetical protein